MARELKLFGTPAVVDGGDISPIRLKRSALLLALLIATPQGMDRAELAERMWEDGDAASRLRRLRRLVYETRAQLGEDALVEMQGRLVLSTGWNTHCDYAHYLALHEYLVDRGVAVDVPQLAFSVICAARAPLLGNWRFDEPTQAAEWIDLQRVAQSSRCRRLRDKIVDALLASGEQEAALQIMLADIERDPLDEAGWERAAAMLFDVGDYSQCVTLYRKLRSTLAQEIGLDVSAAFHRLAKEAQARISLRSVWGTARPATSYVDAGDAHIAYQCFGDGKTDLLLIPGFVSNVEMAWELPQLAALLARLAEDFRVIIFDRRGVGLSDRTIGCPSAEQAVNDVLAVLDAVGSRSAVVFGASEGGPTAIRLCTSHPQRVRALCLCGALARGTANASYTAALTDEQYGRWQKALVADWGTGRSVAAFAPSHADDPALIDWWARLLRLSSSPGAIASILDHLRDVDVIALLPRVHCPTTLLHRRGDRAVRVEASRFMAQRIPNARLIELEGTDHWWWLDDVEPLLSELHALGMDIEQQR